VVARVDRAGCARALADRPVLVEGGSTYDRGLVGAGTLVDVVVGAVRVDGALERQAGVGVCASVESSLVSVVPLRMPQW